MSLRDHILQCVPKPKLHKIHVPDWGRDVFVRELSAKDRDGFELYVSKSKGINFRAALLVRTICDEEGKLVLTERDIPLVGDMRAATVAPIADLAIKVNAIGKSDIEELEKNSQATPSDE